MNCFDMTTVTKEGKSTVVLLVSRENLSIIHVLSIIDCRRELCKRHILILYIKTSSTTAVTRRPGVVHNLKLAANEFGGIINGATG